MNIVRPDGGRAKEYRYDEFGNQKATGGSFYNEVTYGGSITDTTTGLQYMNARFYNPRTGRFLSQDTYSGNPYDPWTQHLYSYCGNNPTSMIDPTGHYFLTPSDMKNKPFMNAFNTRPNAGVDPGRQNGVSGSSISGNENSVWDTYESPPIPDYTEEIRPVLEDNAADAAAVTQMYNRAGAMPITSPDLHFSVSVPSEFFWFYKHVKKGGPWDYKDKEQWETTFPELPYRGSMSTFMFNGEEMKPSDLGNVNYGYTGAAMEINNTVLRVMAGAGQIHDHKNYPWAAAVPAALIRGEDRQYGDEIDDYRFVGTGINWYRNGF